ncbi:MAG: hypothetical protein SF187_19010 [Deltaproteobacteria bacterium]|nr:hypothetical protein [Deltaproteobacteria bacterium]
MARRTLALVAGTAVCAGAWATPALWASRAPGPTPVDPVPQTRARLRPPSPPPSATPEADEPEPPATFPIVGPQRRQRGVALGLFAEDVSFDYQPLLAEIAKLGASHVALIVPLYQEHGGSTSLYLHTRYSPTLEGVAETVRLAKRENLEVTLFPIVRLLHPRAPDEWRGTLAPEDEAKWFASYGQQLGSLAALGAMTGASRFVVGSELSTLDVDVQPWKPLLERLRAVFSGTLVYSANWDHYRKAALLDLVDEAGITGYFDLRRGDGPVDLDVMVRRWKGLRVELEAWARPRHQPWLFTELGYRSKVGSTATPWDETPGGTADAQEQSSGFEAFRQAWTTGSSLAGVYIWNWYGWGGSKSIGYTPRGKPAVKVVQRLLDEL